MPLSFESDGQTGSGKTFTMGTADGTAAPHSSSSGGPSSNSGAASGKGTAVGAEAGMIPRALAELCAAVAAKVTAAQAAGKSGEAMGLRPPSASLRVSFLEIYNEEIR